MRNDLQREPPVVRPATVARRRPLLLGMVLGIVGLIASLLPGAFGLEQSFGLGLLFTVRGPLPPPTNVAVVGISRDAALAVGQTAELDTWPREIHGQLLDRMTGNGASTVAFDLMFHEARPGPGDALFAASIEKAGNVILLERTQSEALPLPGRSEAWRDTRTPPLPQLKRAALGSAPFVLPTVPITVGQFWTFDRAGDDRPSLPGMAVQAHLLAYYEDFVRVVERLRPGTTSTWPQTRTEVRQRHELEQVMTTIRRALAGDRKFRADADRELARGHSPAAAEAMGVLVDLYTGPGSRFLNFYGPARGVPTLTYDFALGASGGLDVNGKALLVGFSEPRQPEQQDAFISVFSQSTGINLSGVELGATAVANLLEHRAVMPLSMALHGGLIVVLGVAFGVLVSPWLASRAAGAAALAGAAYFAVAYWLFTSQHLWLPLLVPLLLQLPASFAVAIWWSYRELAEQRERVRTALGYYVPRSLARRLTEQTLAPGANRQLLHGTCLVTDAEHYTSVAEGLPPEKLAVLVNDYYEGIFRVVKEHGGEISDTAGDSMVAVWASGKPSGHARLQAVRAALAIPRAVEQFNRAHPDSPLPTRVGLESGEMLLGNIGAEQRYEYRAVGDIVNTASRVQGLNTLLGTRVLISATTFDGLELRARDVGTFLLRGKRLPVRVLEPITADSCRLDEDALASFAAALDALRRAEWRAAHDGFSALAARFPGDGPCRYYDGLSRAMRDSPPPAWTGAVRVTEK